MGYDSAVLEKHLPGEHFEDLSTTLHLYNDSEENYYLLTSLQDNNMFNGEEVNVADPQWKRNQFNMNNHTTYETCKDKLIHFNLSESPNFMMERWNKDLSYESCKITTMINNEMMCYLRIKTTRDKFELLSLKRVIINSDSVMHTIHEVIHYEDSTHVYNMLAEFKKLTGNRLLENLGKELLILPYMYPK